MTLVVCPNCGHVFSRPGENAGWQAMTHFRQSVTAVAGGVAPASVPQPIGDFERRAPARAASFESDVLVPATQALITGAVAIVPGILVTVWAGWRWYVPLEIGAGVMTLMWLYLLDAHRKLLWLVEYASNRDIDGDGEVGAPSPAPPVRLEVRHADADGRGKRYQFFDLPDGVTREMLAEFAAGYARRGLSLSAWTGRGKPFSRAQYAALMAVLEDAGIVAWLDPANKAQGRYVTHAGKAALKYAALPLG